MNKIEEILQTYTGCKGTCECGCGLVEAMKEFGKICFEVGKERINYFIDDYQVINKYKYETYENFLKEIEDERRN